MSAARELEHTQPNQPAQVRGPRPIAGDHVDIANGYIDDVLSGRIPAGKPMRQACQRQRDDLARPDWAYTFDRYRANKVCKFLELLPHAKGKWARDGGRIVLEPWQCFILTTVFGWVDGEGLRRFRHVYAEIARKNAKSTLSSGVALYCLLEDDEPGARIVSAATKKDIARLTLDDARVMVDRSPDMQAHYGVETSKHAVYVEPTNSNFVALSKESTTLDGLNPSFALLDEVHAFKSRDLVDVLTSAQGARSQPLLWMITTAGTDLSGIGREEHLYSRKVLDGIVTDERRFVAIFTIDEGDDWQDATTWIKANPNLGVSKSQEYIETEFTRAAAMASSVNNFKTKHLDIWCASNYALFDVQAWQRQADPTLSPEQFAGDDCIIALDLASKKDFTARVKLFERGGHYYAFASHYLPRAAVEQSSNAQYQGWAHDGHITVTEGNIIDYGVIEDDIRADCGAFQVGTVGYDKFQATQLSSNLARDGVPMAEVPNTVQMLSEPTKELEALILAGKIHHTGDPVLEWCVSNVVGHVDAKDNVYPRRESEKTKIDAAVALIMALAVDIQNRASIKSERKFQMI